MPSSSPRPPTRPRTPPAPTDPIELLATPLAKSGLSAAGVLRRAGIRLGWYDVRDLLFHLPRRYDDLRELSKLGDLVWAEEGTVVSARVRVDDVRVEASWRRRVQRTIAKLSDETGDIEATWFGRRFIERRLRSGQEIVVSGRLKRFGRALDDRQPGVPGRRGRRRGAPRRSDRAGLPAHRGIDAPRACGSRSARRSTGPGTPIRSTCPARCGPRSG